MAGAFSSGHLVKGMEILIVVLLCILIVYIVTMIAATILIAIDIIRNNRRK